MSRKPPDEAPPSRATMSEAVASDSSRAFTPRQRIILAVAAIGVSLVIMLSGVVTGIWMLTTRDFTVGEALLVMGLPFSGFLILLLLAAGIYSALGRGTSAVTGAPDLLRFRIVGMLGIGLFISLLGVIALLVFVRESIPDALLTVVSTIAGGLIGALTPATASAVTEAMGKEDGNDNLQNQ